MAVAKKKANESGTLENILRSLAESQRRTDERIAHADERMAQIDERHSDLRRHSDELFFKLSKINAQIIKRLDHIEAVLEEHGKVLERLPEAIRERVGFGRPA